MAIENYLMIGLVYGLGVYASFRLGRNKGIALALHETVKNIAEMTHEPEQKIYAAIVAYRKAKKNAVIS
jgi:hypothetical protein